MISLLAIRELCFGYESEDDLAWRLRVPEFLLNSGDIAVISGDNMSGKSTLLNLVSGLAPLPDDCDSITGPSSQRLTQAELAGMSVILSADDKMFPDLTVRENIVVSCRDMPFANMRTKLAGASALLAESGVFNPNVLDTPLGSLSSGGRALVKLARAFVSDRPLIVVDEISSFLDDTRAAFFMSVAVRLVRQGRGLVIVSHSERDRAVLLAEESASSYHITRSGNSSSLERVKK